MFAHLSNPPVCGGRDRERDAVLGVGDPAAVLLPSVATDPSVSPPETDRFAPKAHCIFGDDAERLDEFGLANSV